MLQRLTLSAPMPSPPLIRLSSFVYTGRRAAPEHSLLPFSLYGAL